MTVEQVVLSDEEFKACLPPEDHRVNGVSPYNLKEEGGGDDPDAALCVEGGS